MKDISEIRRNNLRNLIKQKNLSREELSGLLNMAYSQLAAYIGKTPTKNIGKSVAQRIERKFELPKNWLDQDWDIKNNSTQIKTQYNHNNIQTTAKNNIRLAPVVNTIQAGNFTNIGDDVFDDYSSYFGDYGDDTVYWLRISGNSMFPDFQDGEFVLINTDRQAVAGNYVVAIKDGETKAILQNTAQKVMMTMVWRIFT